MTEPTPIILSSPDAGNRSAGDILRLAREAQRLTIEGLASTIKVAPAKLEALESGQFDRLPDANFTRALAMTVCRALKLDPSEVLAALPAAKPTALAEGKPPLNQPFKDVRGGSPLFEHHWNLSNLLAFKWIAPAVLLLGAALLYALPDSIVAPDWLQKLLHGTPRAEVAVVSSQDAASAPEAEPPAGGMAESMASVPTVPVASAPASVPASGPVGAPTLVLDSAASAPVSAAVPDPRLADLHASAPAALAGMASNGGVALNVREAAWIEVRDANGAKLLSRQVQAGETLSLDGPAPLYLRIGNASGVQVSYKGQPVDLSGVTRNNVARLELK